MTTQTTSPRTILAPGEYTAPDGRLYRALVRVRVGESGDWYTPPSPHEVEGIEPGSVSVTLPSGQRYAVGDLAVPHAIHVRIATIALSRLPAPVAPPGAWERWHEDHGGVL